MTDQHHTPTSPTAAGDTSLIDDMLDLDEVLAADVRRAEKVETLFLKPHLEAEIAELETALARLTTGITSASADVEGEESLADTTGSYDEQALAQQIQDLRREYDASGRKIRLRAMTSDDWLEWERIWDKALTEGAPYPVDMWNSLISKCAVEPEIPVAKVKALRAKLGHPPLQRIADVCWDLNTKAGVSVPFSRLSSAVLKRKESDAS